MMKKWHFYDAMCVFSNVFHFFLGTTATATFITTTAKTRQITSSKTGYVYTTTPSPSRTYLPPIGSSRRELQYQGALPFRWCRSKFFFRNANALKNISMTKNWKEELWNGNTKCLKIARNFYFHFIFCCWKILKYNVFWI